MHPHSGASVPKLPQVNPIDVFIERLQKLHAFSLPMIRSLYYLFSLACKHLQKQQHPAQFYDLGVYLERGRRCRGGDDADNSRHHPCLLTEPSQQRCGQAALRSPAFVGKRTRTLG